MTTARSRSSSRALLSSTRTTPGSGGCFPLLCLAGAGRSAVPRDPTLRSLSSSAHDRACRKYEKKRFREGGSAQVGESPVVLSPQHAVLSLLPWPPSKRFARAPDAASARRPPCVRASCAPLATAGSWLHPGPPPVLGKHAGRGVDRCSTVHGCGSAALSPPHPCCRGADRQQREMGEACPACSRAP